MNNAHTQHTLTRHGTAYSVDGFVTGRGIEVRKLGNMIHIDGVTYPRNELVIEPDRITHKRAGWEVRL